MKRSACCRVLPAVGALLLAWGGAVEAAAPPATAAVSVARWVGARPAAQTLTADCAEGVRYDDGSFEDAVSTPVPGGLQVMSFTLPANAVGLLQVCAALTRVAQAPPDLALNVVVYDSDGPGSTPGTQLASVPATAAAVPVTSSATIDTQFYAFPMDAAAMALPAGRPVYVGLQFDGSQGYFVGVDTSATTPYQPTFASTDGGATWQSEPSVDPDPYRAFGIRVDPQLAATGCVPGSTVMCLQGFRFEVKASYRAAGSPAGVATTVLLTSDTGYLWFFAASNVEAVVKVLDGCALNQHYWVFAGGLTNVRTAITVTDTVTGTSRTYDNPLGTPFQPLQDTSAFDCP